MLRIWSAKCFLVALQAAHRYIPETDSALPWLFGIARRLLAKQRRKYVENRRLEIKVSNAFPAFTAAEDDAIASAIDASKQAPILEEALERLSRSEREVLELVAYADSVHQRLRRLWTSHPMQRDSGFLEPGDRCAPILTRQPL